MVRHQLRRDFFDHGYQRPVHASVDGRGGRQRISAQKLYGLLHIGGALTLFYVPQVNDPHTMFWVMLATMICYMPTISLAIAVAYNAIKREGLDVVRLPADPGVGHRWVYRRIVDHQLAQAGNLAVPVLYRIGCIAGAGSVRLHPATLSANAGPRGRQSLAGGRAGLSSFRLFKDRNMAVFSVFAMLLGAALQLTNAYGDTFLHDFANVDAYKDTLAVRYPAIIMSISQISETLFILTIPFFLRRFGIKTVMTISMLAWFLRFGLFAYGNPGPGLWMIVMSCIVHGMAFDFFNISGSLFVEQQADPKIRASAQGLYMLMTNGIGAVLGSLVAGFVIDHWFTDAGGAKTGTASG